MCTRRPAGGNGAPGGAASSDDDLARALAASLATAGPSPAGAGAKRGAAEMSRAASADRRYINMMENALRCKGVLITTPTSTKSILLKFLENLILLRDNDELAACTRAEKRHRAKPIKDGGNNERELSTRQRQLLLERTGVWGKLLTISCCTPLYLKHWSSSGMHARVDRWPWRSRHAQ